MISDNVKRLLQEVPKFNKYGEEITVVGATKTRTVEEINLAISAGLKDIGENKAQEFRDKFPLVLPCNYHFFGRLQKNKVKYLIGKACLIQSVDSVDLAKEIDLLSERSGVETNILLEVNQGEEQKGGFPEDDVINAFKEISAMKSLKIKGIMTVLPLLDEKTRERCLQTRKLYDILKNESKDISILSMGMSADYKIAIDAGSNMIRVGHAIFGARDYEL